MENNKKLTNEAGAPIAENEHSLTAGPVSYTHLDVYKRQVIMIAAKAAGVAIVPMPAVGSGIARMGRRLDDERRCRKHGYGGCQKKTCLVYTSGTGDCTG